LHKIFSRGGRIIATTWIKPTYAHKRYNNKTTIKRKIDYIIDSHKTNINNIQAEQSENDEGKFTHSTFSSIHEYVQDSDKTENNDLVMGYECSPECAADEFANSLLMYEMNTGRKQKDNSRLLYHMRQSFKPGGATRS